MSFYTKISNHSRSQEVVCYLILDNFKLCVYEITFSLGAVKPIIVTMLTTNALKYNIIGLVDK